MRYGFCTGFATKPQFSIDPSLERAAAGWGYDYIEYPLMAIAAMSNEEFTLLKWRLHQSGLGCDCACNLFPSEVKVIGENVSEEQIKEYLSGAFERAAELGIKKVIFGSSGSRKLGNYERRAANIQFLNCLGILDGKCSEYGMTVLIEAIQAGQADYINTLQEAAAFVRVANLLGYEHVGLMADFYHMCCGKEDLGTLEVNRDILRHVHVAETERGLPCGVFSKYIGHALETVAGFEHLDTVSFETCRPVDNDEGEASLELLKGAI